MYFPQKKLNDMRKQNCSHNFQWQLILQTPINLILSFNELRYICIIAPPCIDNDEKCSPKHGIINVQRLHQTHHLTTQQLTKDEHLN